MKSNAYTKGVEARERGDARSENPYRRPKERAAWYNGFDNAVCKLSTPNFVKTRLNVWDCTG